jgi:hypothetical protein
MGWQAKRSGGHWARSIAIALALLSLIFLLQVTPHEHANGQRYRESYSAPPWCTLEK